MVGRGPEVVSLASRADAALSEAAFVHARTSRRRSGCCAKVQWMFETNKMWHPMLSPGWFFTYDPPQPVPLTEEMNRAVFNFTHPHKSVANAAIPNPNLRRRSLAFGD